MEKINSDKKIPVIFRYPDAKGLFVHVPDFKAGGAPIQISLLAKELAKDPHFKVCLWVDGEVPSEPIDGVQLISIQPPVQKGLPIISRKTNRDRFEAIARDYSNGVYIFTVVDQTFFPLHQDLIHSFGGKTIYRIASSLDVNPELREVGEDAFGAALLKADRIIAQTQQQCNDLQKNYNRFANIVPPAFCDTPYTPVPKDCILWVGHSWTVKRPWVVLELARAFPNEHFTMVMPTVEKGVAKAIADGSEQIRNLEILEFVEPNKIQSLYNRAKLVINTSVFEGFPNTLHQASIGRAPYISLSWDPDRYLEEKKIGHGAGNNVSQMIDILSLYLNDDELRKRTGEISYSNFKKYHDVSRVIEVLKDEIISALC